MKVEIGENGSDRTGSPSWLRLVAWGLWFWLPSVLAERGSEISRYSNHIALSLSGVLLWLCSLRGGESFGQHRDASQVNCAHCRGLASFTKSYLR